MNLEVVIIDDDKILRKVLTRIIQICNLTEEPLQFENGAEALEYFVAGKIDNNQKKLIFLDINMPLMDGWQFLQAMKQKNLLADIELYLLTSSVDQSDHSRAKQDPFIKDVLVKPLTLQKLKSLTLQVN